jgi:hypothetical protein
MLAFAPRNRDLDEIFARLEGVDVFKDSTIIRQ